MNSRVAILTTVCLLFALAWRGDGDRQPSDERVAVRASIPAHLLAAARRRMPTGDDSETAEPNTETLGAHGIEASTAAKAVRVVTTAANVVAPVTTGVTAFATLPADVALPVDIAVGEYRVVGRRGDVFGLILTAEFAVERGLSTDVTPRPHYVREAHGETWHFVRVTPTASVTVTGTECGDRADDERRATMTAEWFEAAVDGLQFSVEIVDESIDRTRTATAGAFQRTADRLVRGTLDSIGTAWAAMSSATGETRRR